MATRKRHQNQNSEKPIKPGKTDSKAGHRNVIKDASQNKIIEIFKRRDIWYITLVLGLACCTGYIHWYHIRNMFERDRHFSHLSTLERELCFRTEMGLYYSYYKTMIESPTFFNGLHQIMYDNVTEYPLTINTLKRFNLYPEVVLAIGKRWYESFMAYMKKPTKMCWSVNRGNNLPPVQSCEGLGEPSYFYTDSIFLWNGLMMAVFFLFGTYLSQSIFGGIMTVICYFYNHGECTRVQWTPPLRESFGYPVFVVQMFIVTYVLRHAHPSAIHSVLIAVASTCFMLSWQFAQFTLLTQIMAVFATYVLTFIGSQKMFVILKGHMLGLAGGFVFLFGNEMLITSFYCACLVTILVILLLQPFVERIGLRLLIWCVQGVLLLVGTVAVKLVISKLLLITDDAHIGDIFRSKFGSFKNFHTMLYTCAKEFDFMEDETPWKLMKTLALPVTLLTLFGVIVMIGWTEYKAYSHSEADGDRQREADGYSRPHAEVVYHIFQLLAFTLMAIIIMRLKLFWTPQLGLFSSLLASRQLFGWLGDKARHYSILCVIFGLMTVQGYANISQQLSIMGEYSNPALEEMIEWIKAKTPPDAVFAGPMPTMATVKLSAQRPIVNHPHYEDAGLRERTKMVYSMYSRKSIEEVRENLLKLHVEYLVLEDSWCYREQRPGCRMADIWDIEDVKNRGKQPACEILSTNPGPKFQKMFKNDVYKILRVVSKNG